MMQLNANLEKQLFKKRKNEIAARAGEEVHNIRD